MTEINPVELPDGVVSFEIGSFDSDAASWRDVWAPAGDKPCNGGPLAGSLVNISGPIGKRCVRVTGPDGLLGYYRVAVGALEWVPV